MFEVLKHFGVWIAVFLIMGWLFVRPRRTSPNPFETILKAAEDEKRQKAQDANETGQRKAKDPAGEDRTPPSALDL